MPDFRPRTGAEFRWPAPWPLMSPAVDWTLACRPHRPPHPDQAAVVMAELVKTLAEQSTIYWHVPAVLQELHERFGVSTTAAFHLIHRCPGGAFVAVGEVWCSREIIAGWLEFLGRVYDVMPAGELLAIDEICAALPGVAPASVNAAVMVLARQERVAHLHEGDDGPFFVRSRPGGEKADYLDLWSVRVGAQQAAA
jgi:hypothetical protein